MERDKHAAFAEHLLNLYGSGLSATDRAFLQELVFGAIRWQDTLDWLINKLVTAKKQTLQVQILLRLGFYQIFFLSKIPPHAAVNEMVNVAKNSQSRNKAGFINAVLRNALRQKDALLVQLDRLKEEDLALGFGHPRWLVERWLGRWERADVLKLLAWNNQPAPVYARLNSLVTKAEELERLWTEENVSFERKTYAWTGETVYLLQQFPSIMGLTSFQKGMFYIQDPSTLLAAQLLEPNGTQTILDLCAAPGGKTTVLAAKMKNQGALHAWDMNEERLKLLRENCTRMAVKNLEAGLLQESIEAAKFDGILVDAPCSNTGVLRRRVELRHRLNPAEIARLAKLQEELLDRAWLGLKPSGTLVYSTCSLEPEENTTVVERFLDKNPNAQLLEQKALLPFEDEVDGAFAAKIRKTALENR